jgi:hypothetical protein
MRISPDYNSQALVTQSLIIVVTSGMPGVRKIAAAQWTSVEQTSAARI